MRERDVTDRALDDDVGSVVDGGREGRVDGVEGDGEGLVLKICAHRGKVDLRGVRLVWVKWGVSKWEFEQEKKLP